METPNPYSQRVEKIMLFLDTQYLPDELRYKKHMNIKKLSEEMMTLIEEAEVIAQEKQQELDRETSAGQGRKEAEI